MVRWGLMSRNDLLRNAVAIMSFASACLYAACDKGNGDCTPGSTQACFGPGACTGAQLCAADGKGYEACDCSQSAGGMSAGGEGGASTAGGGGTGGSAPLLANGASCTDASECESGSCPVQDAVCCDELCDAECESCSAAKTEAATGTCGAIILNSDPDGECLDLGPDTCGPDGTGCNGDGTAPQCNLYDTTTMCGDEPLFWCDGDGSCDTCVVDTSPLSNAPVDMFILHDRSGSMDSNSKWTSTETAFGTFFGEAASAGLGAAFTFFPAPGTTAECNPDAYNPPHVALGQLNGHAGTLVAAIDLEDPFGATPTHGALDGSYQAALAHKTANSDHHVVVVFTTDGDPTDCTEQSVSAMAALASTALTSGVVTYAIAMEGAQGALMDEVAAAGGTTAPFDLTAGIEGFIDVLRSIRDDTTCAFTWPSTADISESNVVFSTDGTDPVLAPYSPSVLDCGAGDGWYVDDGTMPLLLGLCPATCASVLNGGAPTVELHQGCPQQTN